MSYEDFHDRERIIRDVEYCDEIKDQNGDIRPGVKVTCGNCGRSIDEENWYEV